MLKMILIVVIVCFLSEFPSKNNEKKLTIIKPELIKSNFSPRGEKLFSIYCSPCHSIKNELLGPSLNNIKERDEEWLIKFTLNGKKLINENDSIAINLYLKYDRIPHPNFEDQISRKEVIKILNFIRNSETTKDANRN